MKPYVSSSAVREGRPADLALPPMRSRRRRDALALLLGCLLSSCGDPETADRPQRIVLLVLDALHADHMGCYGGPRGVTPHLDRVAAGGVRFANAFSNNTWTLPSTVSLYTGRYQESHGVVTREHVVPAAEVLLPELLQDAGWRTASFVQMLFASERYGLDRGYDEHYCYGFNDGPVRTEMPVDVQRWMNTHAGERYFLYLHFRRPHGRFDPVPALLERIDPGCAQEVAASELDLAAAQKFGFRELPEDEREHVEHLYRANLATVDAVLRPILAACLADPELLLVVTSDHGEGLGQNGFFGHGHALYGEAIDVPLLFRGPGVAPGVDEEPACTVDVLPTLVELLGLWPPPGVALDGVSLAPRLRVRAPAPERAPIRVSARYDRSGPPAVGYVHGSAKLVIDHEGVESLHDRSTGTAGVHGVAASPTLAEALRARARELRAGYGTLDLTGSGEPDLSAEDRADLRALGY